MTGSESSTVKSLDEARRRTGACGTFRGFFPPPTARQAIVAAVAAAVILVRIFSACAAPYVPADNAQVLERLPTAGNQNLRELRRLHADLARNPGDLALAIRVATQDMSRAR